MIFITITWFGYKFLWVSAKVWSAALAYYWGSFLWLHFGDVKEVVALTISVIGTICKIMENWSKITRFCRTMLKKKRKKKQVFRDDTEDYLK